MNFDYLKDVERLNKAYYCCNNAEELALSKPDLSVFSSRKSAEQIAKYVYLVAYAQEAEDISFSEILSDPIFKDYLRNRSVLDAFHYIRKNGNKAAHTMEVESPEEAVKVLEKLYYVVGEVAKRMELIMDYPPFDDNITEHPDAEMLGDEIYGNLAKEMYDEYIIYCHKIDVLKAQFSELSAKFRFAPGHVAENEIIEYKKKPETNETIYRIQEYFGTIGVQALKRIADRVDDNNFSYKLELSLFGDDGYTTKDLANALYGVLYDLPKAEGFRIASYYSGPQVSSLFEEYSDADYGFYNFEEFIGLDEVSMYKRFEFLDNHGAGGCVDYKDGDWIKFSDRFSKKIIRKSFGMDWWTWDISLVIEFDFDKYPDKIQNLHDSVRKHVPESELEYCERNWSGEDPEWEILLDGIQWCPRKLQEVQVFLDEVNKEILPIKDECEFRYDGNWYITESPMAVATITWTDDGFKIVGTTL